MSGAGRLLGNRSVRARLAALLAVALATVLVVAGVSLGAQSALRSQVVQVSRTGTLVHEVDTINYYNADMSGWLASFAWDADFMGGAKAVAPTSEDRAGFLADRPLLLAALAGAHTVWMTPAERSAFTDLKERWSQFLDLDTQIVAIYRQNTPAAVVRARNVIQNQQYAVYFKIVDDATRLAKSIQARSDDAKVQALRAADNARRVTIVAALVGLVLVGGLTWLVIASISVPLRRITAAVDALARGDLTASAGVDTQDEIGRMAQGLDVATASMRKVLGALSDDAASLSSAGERLTGVSGSLLTTVRATARRTEEVDRVGTEVSGTISSIAAGAEEMSGSISQIAASAHEAAAVGNEAAEIARVTNDTVGKLDESSREVGNILKVISSIAEQTNLLALNATIEAARAGEAGKGFAVVATEVKDLAHETAQATEDISRRIEAIQSDTNAAVEAIASITEIIGRLGDHQTTIASAVEEQTATAAEISRSVSLAAGAIDEMAHSVSEVARTSGDTTGSVQGLSQAATDLAGMSGRLREVVASFRV